MREIATAVATTPGRSGIVARDILAANAPLVVFEMNRFLNQIAPGVADPSLSNAAHKASMLREDAKEGIAAWFERRRPNFRGP
jgi:hypothetical protein